MNGQHNSSPPETVLSDSRFGSLQKLVDALPKAFDFYHLGEVKMESTEPSIQLAPDLSALAYRIQGDLTAVLVLLFPLHLDQSTYAEMGNVIASQLATQANDQAQLDLMISPPRALPRVQLDSLLQKATVQVRKTYAHLHRNHTADAVIFLETLLLSVRSETLSTKEPEYV